MLLFFLYLLSIHRLGLFLFLFQGLEFHFPEFFRENAIVVFGLEFEPIEFLNSNGYFGLLIFKFFINFVLNINHLDFFFNELH